jgi:hypothetical protein
LDDGEEESSAPVASSSRQAPAKPVSTNQFDLLDDDEVDDDEALAPAPVKTVAKSTPAPAPPAMDDDEDGDADDVAPAPVPVKKTITKKVIVKSAVAKKV